MQLDQRGLSDPNCRKSPLKGRLTLLLKFDGHAENVLRPHLPPMSKALMRR